MPRTDIDFLEINRAALCRYPGLLMEWIPGGRLVGREFTARNPLRGDRRPGSFSINVLTGRWADFATGDSGGDPVSLYAYLRGLKQAAAARELAALLGVDDVH